MITNSLWRAFTLSNDDSVTRGSENAEMPAEYTVY